MSDTNNNPPISGGPFSHEQVCRTHKALIDASLEIGAIAESAHWASMALAERLAAQNLTVSELTVAELIAYSGGQL